MLAVSTVRHVQKFGAKLPRTPGLYRLAVSDATRRLYQVLDAVHERVLFQLQPFSFAAGKPAKHGAHGEKPPYVCL
jgi:hypothetical protein